MGKTLHGNKRRLDLGLSPKAYNVLENTHKLNRISKCLIVENLIMQKLADPIGVLKEQKKELLKQIGVIDDRIELLKKNEVWRQRRDDNKFKGEKMTQKPCSSCGQLIYFKRNTEGKFVPFNASDDRCHFESCTRPPKLESKESEDIVSYPQIFKPKVSYKTIRKNQTWGGFV